MVGGNCIETGWMKTKWLSQQKKLKNFTEKYDGKWNSLACWQSAFRHFKIRALFFAFLFNKKNLQCVFIFVFRSFYSPLFCYVQHTPRMCVLQAKICFNVMFRMAAVNIHWARYAHWPYINDNNNKRYINASGHNMDAAAAAVDEDGGGGGCIMFQLSKSEYSRSNSLWLLLSVYHTVALTIKIIMHCITSKLYCCSGWHWCGWI